MTTGNIAELAKRELKDASRFLFFDGDSVIASSFTVDHNELKPLMAHFDDRDNSIKHGIILQGARFEVHRHHPPLVYGRTMGGSPEQSEGVALCRVERGQGGAPAYGLITYQMPNISARMVPLLHKFCTDHLVASTTAA